MCVLMLQSVSPYASVLMFVGLPMGIWAPLEMCGDSKCGVGSSFHTPCLLILLEGLTTAYARLCH